LKTIYVITHGSKDFGKNPAHNSKGISQIILLKHNLPQDIDYVICGTGVRHLGAASLLELDPDYYSSLVGESESLEELNNKKYIILADGSTVPFTKFSSLEDMAPAYKPFLLKIPTNTLLIAGRPFMIMIEKFIDYQDASSAALYRIKIDEKNEKFSIEKLFQA
jgi:hypothetical protein